MESGGQEQSKSSRILEALREKESLLWRTVLWLETLIVVCVLLFMGMGDWGIEYGDVYNIGLVVLLASAFISGIVLFMVYNLQIERQGIFLLLLFLTGLLLISYSTLMYETGTAASPEFVLTLLSGSILTVFCVGLMVVRLRQTSRLTGYYSMWLFGLLLIMFMPLHELGFILQYSGRDLVVGYLGLAVSIIGAISFAVEHRQVLNVDSWVTAGDAKYISGKFDEAIEYYDRALGADPLNELVWSSKGASLLKLGMWTDAVRCFDKAIELNPELPLAYSGKGLALTPIKRYSEALESHDKAIELGMGPIGWNNKGNTIMRMGAPAEEALVCYVNALRIEPEYDVAWYNKGKAELVSERYSEAVSSFTRAVEIKPRFSDAWFQKGKALASSGAKEEEALFCLDTAIQLKPSNPDAWMEREILQLAMKEKKVKPIPIIGVTGTALFGPGRLLPGPDYGLEEPISAIGRDRVGLREDALKLAEQGDYDGAVAVLDESISQNPDDPLPYMTKGVLLSRIERFDDALAAFDKVLEFKPEWVGPWFSRGMILAARGDYEEAIRSLDEAISIRYNYADAWAVKGIILGILRDYSVAISCFDKVIEIRPDDAEAWRSKGIALNKLGKYDEAIECYEKLSTLDPAIEETHRILLEEKEKLEGARALFKQGVELAKTKEYMEGLARLREAINLRPNYVDALYISGVVYGVIGGYVKAMYYFERVLKLRPEHVEALYGKGNILLKEERYGTAIEIFERVLKLNPNHVDALCDKGLALTKLDRQDEAVECYDSALKLAGDHQRTIILRESCVKAARATKGPRTP